MTKFFFLAHYDDEIFALPLLSKDEKNCFIFLTNGVGETQTSVSEATRYSEAMANIHSKFENLDIECIAIGRHLGIWEGSLYERISEVVENFQIKRILAKVTSQDCIITTTFEGAHQDHDACCILSRRLGETYQLNVIELSTYPQRYKSIYSFSVMRPTIKHKKIPRRRVQNASWAIRLIIGYKTQRRTWIGLGIPVIFSYLFNSFYTCKPLAPVYLEKCFYEYRGRAKQSKVLTILQKFAQPSD